MWTVANPALTCSLVGSRTVAQLEANLRAVAWPLAADVMARLNAITGHSRSAWAGASTTTRARRTTARASHAALLGPR